jgi:DUF218 domain-containing protein
MRLRVTLIVILLGLLSLRSGRYLIVDDPQKSDVILVLAGETQLRPERALELLSQGYGAKVILDVPAQPRFYSFSQAELVQKFIATLPQPERISICQITGLSTREESRDASLCLAGSRAHRVLLVTTSFHTRRALSIFRRELPGYEFSIAAVNDPRQFGVNWWSNRQWAKVNLEEWMRMSWWQLVDRWK